MLLSFFAAKNAQLAGTHPDRSVRLGSQRLIKLSDEEKAAVREAASQKEKERRRLQLQREQRQRDRD